MAVATVCIPAAPHHTHLLERAVESVRAQTVATDVLTFIDHDKRGPGHGRNVMAQQVKTPFLIFLDADDLLEPAFVERTVAAYLTRKPRGYVFTDWQTGGHHMKSMSCYGIWGEDDEAKFHPVTTLFPTRLFHALGGFDETLWAGEDTDFYMRANAAGVQSVGVREPLMQYTADGFRSKEGYADPRWKNLMSKIYAKVEGRLMPQSCAGCGNTVIVEAARITNEKLHDDDVLARPVGNAMFKRRGAETGTLYGRLNSKHTVWVRAADFNPRDWTEIVATPEIVPTAEEIEAARKAAVVYLTTEQKLVKLITERGVRTWSDDEAETEIKTGHDIQQHPEELAKLVLLTLEERKKSAGDIQATFYNPRVMEIGTGENAGLARFLVEDMEWAVLSIDPNAPVSEPQDGPEWVFEQMSSEAYELPEDEAQFDLLIIDGDPALRRHDFDKFGSRAHVVALHDITGHFHPEAAEAWKALGYTKAGNLRKGFSEIIAEGSKLGIGVYVNA